MIQHNMIIEERRHLYMAATKGFDAPLPDDAALVQDKEEVPLVNFI
jgi:hypothetical protein